MSEVRHRGRRRVNSPGYQTGYATYDYVSPGVTLPNENPEKWEELSGPVIVTKLTPSEMEDYFKNNKKK